MRAWLLVATFFCLGVDQCDPEAMSGSSSGRRQLAERAQKSTRDIQSLQERVDELERQVAALKEAPATSLSPSSSASASLEERVAKIERSLQSLDKYMKETH